MSGKNRCSCRCRCRSAAADEATTPDSLLVLPEDIIIDEILHRLHVKALFTFKCVSKRYTSIISSPNFRQTYLQRAYSSQASLSSSGLLSLSLLLFPFTDPSLSLNNNVKNLTNAITDSNIDPIRLSSISLPNHHQSQTLLGSSNGLLLSLFHHTRSELGLCVSNPLTNQSVQLPRTFTPTSISELEFGIATRHFLTYKIVSMRCVVPEGLQRHEYAKTTIEIFSSNTGSWASREVSCPYAILNHYKWSGGFAYKGTLHWLDNANGIVLTYDPFDSPERFGSILLPKEGYNNSCLIYSGDQEMLKYCGIHFGHRTSTVFAKLWVWGLMDPEKGEWCLEHHMFEVFDFHLIYGSGSLMVAPNPCNRQLICLPCCHLDMKDNSGCVRVSNIRKSSRISVKVFSETQWKKIKERCGYMKPLIPIELCPWSSPFYLQS